jgi:hypothetical protein
LVRVSNNIPYTGPYINTVFGEKYIGDSPRNQGEKLIYPEADEEVSGPSKEPYESLNPEADQQTELRSPINGNPQPTIAEQKKGYMSRYFFLDIRTKVFIEATKEEYSSKSRIDTVIFAPYSFRWWLSESALNQNTVDYLRKRGSVNIDAADYSVDELYDLAEERAGVRELEDDID